MPHVHSLYYPGDAILKGECGPYPSRLESAYRLLVINHHDTVGSPEDTLGSSMGFIYRIRISITVKESFTRSLGPYKEKTLLIT